jgi:hypothetical protein
MQKALTTRYALCIVTAWLRQMTFAARGNREKKAKELSRLTSALIKVPFIAGKPLAFLMGWSQSALKKC